MSTTDGRLAALRGSTQELRRLVIFGQRRRVVRHLLTAVQQRQHGVLPLGALCDLRKDPIGPKAVQLGLLLAESRRNHERFS